MKRRSPTSVIIACGKWISLENPSIGHRQRGHGPCRQHEPITQPGQVHHPGVYTFNTCLVSLGKVY